MIWTIICFIFCVFMAVRAVSKKDATSLLFYLFVNIVVAASVVTWPTFYGNIEGNLMFCGIVGFIDMVCLVIVLMLT